jgi:hypothetical protein
MSEWQKVEDHPLRGEDHPPERLLWAPNVGIVLGFVHHYEDGDLFTTASGYHGFTFTHWQALPKPPGDDK